MFLVFLLFLVVITANANTFLVETGNSVEDPDDYDYATEMGYDYVTENGFDYVTEAGEDQKKPITLKVLLMNIWGLRLAKKKNTRIPEIAKFLKKSIHDIVFIQEAWYYPDYKQLRDTFPYYTFFGTPGSLSCPPTNDSQSLRNRIVGPLDCHGLTILSKHKILEIDHKFFTDRIPKIREKAVKRGGFAARMKVQTHVDGVLKTVKVSAINTHLATWYDETEKKWSNKREKQADDVIKMVEAHKTKSDIVIVGGDFNSLPGSPVYNKFISAGLTDTLVELEGENSSDPKFATYGHSKNKWSSKYDADRIDFIMYTFDKRKVVARTSAYKTVIAETEKDGEMISLSDHQWVEASITINIKE